MAHSINMNYAHIVYATHKRRRILAPEHFEMLSAYSGVVLAESNAKLMILNGHVDHVHLLVGMPLSKAPSDIVREVKANSSRWIKENTELPDFAWQRRYAYISVSPDRVPRVKRYIKNQHEHHSHIPLEAEFKSMHIVFD